MKKKIALASLCLALCHCGVKAGNEDPASAGSSSGKADRFDTAVDTAVELDCHGPRDYIIGYDFPFHKPFKGKRAWMNVVEGKAYRFEYHRQKATWGLIARLYDEQGQTIALEVEPQPEQMPDSSLYSDYYRVVIEYTATYTGRAALAVAAINPNDAGYWKLHLECAQVPAPTPVPTSCMTNSDCNEGQWCVSTGVACNAVLQGVCKDAMETFNQCRYEAFFPVCTCDGDRMDICEAYQQGKMFDSSADSSNCLIQENAPAPTP